MCEHKNGDISNLFGITIDPCIYKEIEAYKNVTVIISKCVNCGANDISWKRQEDTEEIEVN